MTSDTAPTPENPDQPSALDKAASNMDQASSALDKAMKEVLEAREKCVGQKASVIFVDLPGGGMSVEAVYDPPLDETSQAAVVSRSVLAAAQVVETIKMLGEEEEAMGSSPLAQAAVAEIMFPDSGPIKNRAGVDHSKAKIPLINKPPGIIGRVNKNSGPLKG